MMANGKEGPLGALRRLLRPEQEFPEKKFQNWYANYAFFLGLDPNPDSPYNRYDWRAAFLAGAKPEIHPADGLPHWPSEFKMPTHPNRFVEGLDTHGKVPRRLSDLLAKPDAAAQFIPTKKD